MQCAATHPLVFVGTSQQHMSVYFTPDPCDLFFCRMARHTAGGDPASVETQTKICFAALAVTTGPAASVWTRADAHSTAAEHPGCTAASSAAAWSVYTHTHLHTHLELHVLKADLHRKSLSVVKQVCQKKWMISNT